MKLRSLEKAAASGYKIMSGTGGTAEWVLDAGGAITVNLTPIAYIPTATGNASNLNQAVIDPNGAIWIIDESGNAIQIAEGSSFSGSWNELTDVPAGFADGVDNSTDGDADPSNEIQESGDVNLTTPLSINSTVCNTVQEALEALQSSSGSGTDDQVASEVPVTPTGNLASTDVQAALEELQGDVDGLSGGGGALNSVFHRRLTFGTDYSLPIGVLDTSDVISLYAGAQISTPTTITLPTLSDTINDGKVIIMRLSAAEDGSIIRVTSPDSTDVLVQGCQTGSVSGPDTVFTALAVQWIYVISNGKYYRICDRPVVNQLATVGDTSTIRPHPGDVFVVSTGDTAGWYDLTAGWVLFYGGGGGGSGTTIDSVFTRNDSVFVSENSTEFFTQLDQTGRNTSAPTSFGGDGTNIHFAPRVQAGTNDTNREEFPGIAYNPATRRLVLVYRYASAHAYVDGGRGLAQYSDDFGQTWSDTVTFTPGRLTGEDLGVDPGIFYDQVTRKFLATGVRREDASATNELVILYASSDGETWATYDTITKPFGAFGWRILNPLSRLNDNRLAGAGYTFQDGVANPRVYFVHSSDNGATWSSVLVATGATTSNSELNEPQLIETPDGTLYIYVRSDTDDALYRYQSTDAGATWGIATDVTPDGWSTALGSKPSFHVFGDSTLFGMFRKDGTTLGAPAYSVSTDWGNTWTTVQDVPQSDSEARWFYAAYTGIDANTAFYAYSEGQNTSTTGATAPNVFTGFFSSGGSNYKELVQADVVKLREHTPGTLLEGSAYYDGTSIRFQNASEAKAVQHNNYNARIATAGFTVALGNASYNYEKINVNSVDTIVVDITGGLAGGHYVFHFWNADTSFINLPQKVKDINYNAKDVNADSAAVLDCYYDGTDFSCTIEGADFVDSLDTLTLHETIVDIGGAYLYLNAAQETEYADEASVDTIHDWSGNARHFYADAGEEPTFDSLSATSGYATFKFDGTEFVQNSTAALWEFLHEDSSTFFIVLKPGNTSNPDAAYGIYGNNSSATANVGTALYYDDRSIVPRNDVISVNAGQGTGAPDRLYNNTSSDGVVSANTYHNVIHRSDPLNATASDRSLMNVDSGVAIANNADNNAGISPGTGTYNFQVGATGNDVFPFVGEIAVFVIWDRILTPSEITSLQSAYNNEY